MISLDHISYDDPLTALRVAKSSMYADPWCGPCLAHHLTFFHSFLSNLLTIAAVDLFSHTAGTLIQYKPKDYVRSGTSYASHQGAMLFRLWSLPALQVSHHWFFPLLIAILRLCSVRNLPCILSRSTVVSSLIFTGSPGQSPLIFFSFCCYSLVV